MNNILNRGFASPFIIFQFAAGTIDTIPPRYFMRFKQDRTVSQACNFELEIMYAPGNFNEDSATLIHSLLLSSVNQPVTYRYGYVTKGGGLQLQNQCYTGIFTTYNESLHEGYQSYVIQGVANEVIIANEQFTVSKVMEEIKRYPNPNVQPSRIALNLITGENDIGISELFEGYDIYIDNTDEWIPKTSIHLEDGTLHDIFFGKSNSDKSSLPNGLVSLSYRTFEPYELLSNGLISTNEMNFINNYDLLNTYNSSGIQLWMKLKYNYLKNLQTMPFVCFFDNVVDSIGSTSKGSFYYVEKRNQQVTNIFTYNVGNSFLDSDVLDFSVSYDCLVAMNAVPMLNKVESNIDANGQNIGSNYISIQTDNFVKNTYNTFSGFNESAFLTTSTIADALNFPIEATMTVVGQIDCNRLMDVITVNVYVNGLKHPGLTGDYIILGIEDNLSDSGFTTTFTLQSAGRLIEESTVPEFFRNSDTSRAWQNQQYINDSM